MDLASSFKKGLRIFTNFLHTKRLTNQVSGKKIPNLFFCLAKIWLEYLLHNQINIKTTMDSSKVVVCDNGTGVCACYNFFAMGNFLLRQ